ncbi:MAG: UDP-N-acetylmuramoyl-L-alanine--D-glutamate ligase [bacterium]|nr:UDP-N-acetylmuramoyl-L-alanine--D-glutamate ligase [bacterium]
MTGKKKIAILGWGLEGRWLFNYLHRDKNSALAVLDQKFGRNYLKNLERFDVIYRSPGVPYNLPQIRKVKRKMSSLTKLFFESAQGKIVGITGSAGKTTTATLLHKILKAARRDVHLAGNIGKNPLTLLPKLSGKSVTILELSSFQLQDLSRSPELAIVLDVHEEHLDKHKTLGEYLRAKENIARFQKRSDFVIYAGQNRRSKKIASRSPGKKIAVFASGGEKYETLLLGSANLKNIAAAAAAAELLGVKSGIIRKAIKTFRGIEHRLEYVRAVGGIKFYNDSKATNVGSAVAGLEAFKENKIVLAGGHSKNLSFRPYAKRLVKPDVSWVVLFGKARREIARELRRAKSMRFSSVSSLDQAVREARRRAKKGEIIILSPAAASFDAFKNYEERGEYFKKLVRRLK